MQVDFSTGVKGYFHDEPLVLHLRRASRSESLYLGMTNGIERSMREHKSESEGFASKER